jgi:hypothetical protein
MKSVKVVVEQSTKIKFIVLQVLIVLLVAATLVSFSDIKLPPFAKKELVKEDNTAIAQPAIQNEVADPALKIKLEESEKLNLDKQTRINELEKELATLQATKNQQSSANQPVDLTATVEQLKLQHTNSLNEKNARIRELETSLTALQNQKNRTVAPTDNKAVVDKLRSDLQKAEARNSLLEKLNADLKKNNEYLSALNKASR